MSEISIVFEGSLDHPNFGFYYVNDEIGITHFESIFAGKCFPCFDQPSVKTEFDISLRNPNYLKAFSNMPVMSQEKDELKTIWKFQRTPMMCSYLLAFAI